LYGRSKPLNGRTRTLNGKYLPKKKHFPHDKKQKQTGIKNKVRGTLGQIPHAKTWKKAIKTVWDSFFLIN
jgi:desulfoferrodoxin (superoxide reductase-like protein)